MNQEENNNDIEVVVSDDNELEISPVYDHLNFDKPREKEIKKEIIIPEVKQPQDKKDE